MIDKTIDFISKAIIIHGDLYDYSLVIYEGCRNPIKIICKKHGIFEQKPTHHLENKGCKKCSNEKKKNSIFDFISKARITHGDLYDYSLVEYIGCKEKVKIICKKHGIFEQTPDNHIRRRGCPDCDPSKKSNNDDFISKARIIHGDLYDYSSVYYENDRKNVKIICKTHGIFEQSPNNHLRGTKCPTCKSLSKIKTESNFILDSISKHGDLYDYSLVKYNGSTQKVSIICRKHGIFEQKANNHLSGQGCPICKSSKGEIVIMNYLDIKNIEYIREYRFSDCRNKNPLPFDFFLPKLNICIEFNGIQHYKEIEYFTRNVPLSETNLKDYLKKTYCEKNNIKLIVIKYNENIIEKLNNLI